MTNVKCSQTAQTFSDILVAQRYAAIVNAGPRGCIPRPVVHVPAYERKRDYPKGV